MNKYKEILRPILKTEQGNDLPLFENHILRVPRCKMGS